MGTVICSSIICKGIVELLPSYPFNVCYLVVAGGGGGGNQAAGGGGAGGLLLGTLNANANVTYTVVVGGGGAGQATNGVQPPPVQGSNSCIQSIIAVGGGYGGMAGNPSYINGGSGGSGGGGATFGSSLGTGGIRTSGQGSNGGQGGIGPLGSGERGGGGGGASAAGASGVSSGNGGNGGGTFNVPNPFNPSSPAISTSTIADQIGTLTALRATTESGTAINFLLKEHIDTLANATTLSSLNALGDEQARMRAMGMFDTPGITSGSLFDPSRFRRADEGGTNVTVIVEGSVISQQDLTEAITDQLYLYQKSGKGIFTIA